MLASCTSSWQVLPGCQFHATTGPPDQQLWTAQYYRRSHTTTSHVVTCCCSSSPLSSCTRPCSGPSCTTTPCCTWAHRVQRSGTSEAAAPSPPSFASPLQLYTVSLNRSPPAAGLTKGSSPNTAPAPSMHRTMRNRVSCGHAAASCCRHAWPSSMSHR
eukprot:CAMPEP_0202920594 /NCGR_PEP_ID=MMETSP1392-20130828/76940_1 /ASSEMBLY_ACC=CAM_ASM_000868 /TAXON_ID=225041 /ORGANISM="Chlamydomonas chlamydogama, Strain SAG 11-48b" /LENGTH=157 /DNA_ID=CAMNT_0049614097 /DNA_START=278 /DNA_END=751 /DNA_ORIENTATION=-